MAKKEAFNVGCEFGGVSIGKETARLSIKVPRDAMPLEDADRLLCGRRITGTLTGKPRGQAAEQKNMVDNDVEISGVFDVKRLGFNGDDLSFGATFMLNEIDVSVLARFAKRIGRLVARASEVIPEAEAA